MEERLELLLQEEDGVVNFSEIAKALSVRPSKLLHKKHIPDIVHNFTALCGDGTRVVQKGKDKTYYTHPGLAVAAIKIMKRVSLEKIHEWECKHGRADIPDQIAKDTPALLKHVLSILGNGKFRCVLKAGKWRFSLNDILKLATGDKNTGRTLDKIASSYPELQEMVSNSDEH